MARVFRSGVVISGQGGSGIFSTPVGQNTGLIVPMQSGQSNIAGAKAIGFQAVPTGEFDDLGNPIAEPWIVRCNPDGSGLEQLKQVGCNIIVGGQSEFAWSVLGNVTDTQTSWGLSLPGAVAMWMTDDDALIVLMNYSTGRGVACYRKGNMNAAAPDWSVPDAVTLTRYPYPQLFALDADRVVWCDVHGNMGAYGMPVPAPALNGFVNPFVVEHPDGSLWLGCTSGNDQVYVRPFNDAARGYVLGTGYGASGAGSYAAWALNTGENAAVAHLIDWSQPTVPLTTPTVPPPVVVPPPPPIPPPGVPIMEKIPQDVLATSHEFARVFPPPHGDGGPEYLKEALQFGWARRHAEQIRFSHGAKWGHKATSKDLADTAPSKETLAYREDANNADEFDCFDMLGGAGSGNPVYIREDQLHHHVKGQFFIEVQPIDHLNLIVRSPIVRPDLPFMKAMSSFDFCIKRDPAWLGFGVSLAIPFQRVIVWSKFRDGRDLTLEQALRNLDLGLADLRARGLYADVTFHCDTRERGDTREDLRRRTPRINAVLVKYLDVVKAARLFNENSHSVEQWFAVHIPFLMELDAMVDARIPLAWGAGHGGEGISPTVAGGSWIAHHGDRSKTPEENAAIMKAAQIRYGRKVVNAEPIGFEKNAIHGKRVNDLDWARRQAQADKDAGLGGSCFHFTAGIWAEVDLLDDVQREAGRIFSQTLTGGPVPPPTPIPPAGHPILDAPLSPAYPVGYKFWIRNWGAIHAEARAWFVRATGRTPAPEDIGHGVWRGLNEGERWKTLRAAWEDAWPGGAPR